MPEPRFRKICLKAKDFDGGIGHEVFVAHERLSPGDGLRYGQTSSPKETVAVGGDGSKASQVRTGFELDESFFSSQRCRRQHWLWITGMWEHYRFLSHEFVYLDSTMPTCGHFRIVVNDTVVLDDKVFFWNYRHWRFWPWFELPVAESAFGLGANSVLFENLTRPFAEGIPQQIRQFFPSGFHDADPDARSESAVLDIPDEIGRNTVFNLSEIQIVTRDFSDLQVLSTPEVVKVGQPFLVEVFATREHTLKLGLDKSVKLLSSKRLKPGRNQLFFQVTEPCGNTVITAKSKDTGDSLSSSIRQAVSSPDGQFLLGHTIGGHLTAFPLRHNYKTAIELFSDTNQGQSARLAH